MAIIPNINPIELESTDKWVFVVSEPVARQSQLLNRLLENRRVERHPVKIPVTAEVLHKAILYCKKHSLGASSSLAMHSWDMQFVDVGPAMLDGLLSAALYLQIDPLYALVCEKKADVMNGNGNGQGRSKKPRTSGPGF